MKKLLVAALILSYLFTSCAPAPTSTPVSTETSTPSPTATVTPSNTPYLTPTRLPTRTKAPTKTPPPSASLDEARPGQYAFAFQASSGVNLQYWVYFPASFDPNKQWPLILFLHGSDERGITIDRVKTQGLPEILNGQTDIPFIVISPQLDSGWWDYRIEDMNELLDYLVQTLPIDPNRLYLTGISLGGFGTWSYALQYPDRFAAIVPIAGGYDEQAPENICTLKDLPIWVFHGEADTAVAPYYSQVLVDALKACGSDVIFTLYPDTSHISTWDKAYADPALYEWLLIQKK